MSRFEWVLFWIFAAPCVALIVFVVGITVFGVVYTQVYLPILELLLWMTTGSP